MSRKDLSELRLVLAQALEQLEQPKLLFVIIGDDAKPSANWRETQPLELPDALTEKLEVALVGPGQWFDALSRLVPRSPYVKAHHFDKGQREAALRWLLS